jgi:pyruvate dehydrogenase E1 component alpha subunit
MHIADFSVGMLGANGVVAAGIPIGVGAAHAMKLQGDGRVVVCFFGDGAINRGPFLEALNWAKIYALPILFVCEDNQYSSTTRTRELSAGEGPAARAEALGIPAASLDGNDVIAVDRLAGELLTAIRGGSGPRFLHALTYRLKGHTASDQAAYRTSEEVAARLTLDPLKRTAEALASLGVGSSDLAAIEVAAKAEIGGAYAAAKAAPWPATALAFADIQDVGEGQWR